MTDAAARRDQWAALLGGCTAAIGFAALAIEFQRSLAQSFALGRAWPEALFQYFRFFSILTNIGVVVLLALSAVRLASRRAPPPPLLFNAALIYILVTCATYEFMLRALWTPHGLQFVTDMVIHDVVPALMLLFWLTFAPRDGARWSDARWVLIYPACYFALTLLAGAFGAGYPYGFLDVGKLGLPRVLLIAMIFLAIFYGASLLAIAICKSRTRSLGVGRHDYG